MKRGAIDALRRGLDNTIANWPLILLRFAEAFLFILIGIGAAVAIVVPIVVSLGVNADSLRTPEGISDLLEIAVSRWVLIGYVFAVITVIAIIFVAIHSLVQAGCVRVYTDGDRMAGPELNGPRSRFNVFSIQRFLAGAGDGWWTLFWIYNLAWGLAGIITMIPLVPVALAIVIFQETPEAMVAIGCLGAALTMMLLVLVWIVVSIWSNRAVASWGVTRAGARASLANAWRSFKLDFGRLLLAAVALFVISMAGSTFFASFSFISGLMETVNDSGVFELVTMPIRFAASLASTAFSAAMAGWFLSTFVSFAVEEGK